MIYFDSSALVKRYLKEEGTDAVRSIIKASRMITTSKLTYPEMLSAFMRKFRAGEISRKLLQVIFDKFEIDWSHLVLIEFHDELLRIGKGFIEKYPLKGADTIHLSSAVWIETTAKAKLTFVSSDENLLKAARGENLRVANPLGGEP